MPLVGPVVVVVAVVVVEPPTESTPVESSSPTVALVIGAFGPQAPTKIDKRHARKDSIDIS